MQIRNIITENGRSLARESWLLNTALSKLRHYPKTRDDILEWKLYNKPWYYDVELSPDVIAKGQYSPELPLLPRMLLRNCNLNGLDCLDIGSMEGLIPVLMRKQGASRVLATDFNYHCYSKMAAVMHYYDVEFSFKQIGSMYDLTQKIRSPKWQGFDLVNISGVLYHTFSPFNVMAGLRPLLKNNGLMIVSTNVIDQNGYAMEFNKGGRFQSEPNTFWYLTIPLFDYMLRYFQLEPIDCLLYQYQEKDAVWAEGSKAGYMSVVCRAVDDKGAELGDNWMTTSISKSWEYLLCDQKIIDDQPVSTITYRDGHDIRDLRDHLGQMTPLEAAPSLHDTHLLRLTDRI